MNKGPTGNSWRVIQMEKTSVVVLILLFLNGCSASYGQLSVPQPSENPPPSTVRRLSTRGDFTAEAYQQDAVGEMSPVYLILRNDTSLPHIVSRKRLVAVNAGGAKVPNIPAEEAARQAGEVGAAPGMWKGAATGAGVGAVIGGIAGSLIGLVLGGPIGMARGAIIGGAGTGGVGAVAGADQGAVAGTLNAQTQVLTTHLRDQVLQPGSQVAGYVYFPKATFGNIHLVISSDEERDQEVIVPVQSQQADK
jgi:hypothetical protein